MAANMEAVLKVKLLGYFKEKLVQIFAPKDLVTTEKEGLMSKEDKAKLNGIQAGATNYQHPSTHGADMITETTDRKWTSPTEKQAWNDAKAKVEQLRTEYDAHVGGITEVTDVEVKALLDKAGLTEIA